MLKFLSLLLIFTQVSFAGFRKVPSRDIREHDIAEGRVVGIKYVNKFGANTDVDGAEDIWGGGGNYTGFPSGSAETFEVFSSNAADASAGTGARTVRIFYLDANKNCFDSSGNWLTADVTMDGVTGVDTTVTGKRVWRVRVLTTGSGLKNAGSITVRHTTTTANIFSVMPAGTSQSQISAFTVCNGWSAYLEKLECSMLDQTANTSTISIIEKLENGTEIQIAPFLVSTDYGKAPILDRMVKFLEKTDLIVRALEVKNANGRINIHYRLRLVKNPE